MFGAALRAFPRYQDVRFYKLALDSMLAAQAGQLLGYEPTRSFAIAVVVRVRRLSLIVQEEVRALRGATSLLRTRRAAEVVECCQGVRRAAVGKSE